VSRATIRNHVQNIFAKLKVHTRLQAVLDARARDLL
jgi:DNA-binding NarL/FixJ family response regulator